MEKTLIRVGHSAYKGNNAYRLCFSRAQAIRVLRNRGVKRDNARSCVKAAMENGGATVWGEFHEVIEIVNEKWAFDNGHYYQSYSEIKRVWKDKSEL